MSTTANTHKHPAPAAPAAPATPAAAPKPQVLQPIKSWSYPFAPNNDKAAGPQPYLAALGKAEDGSFPLGANGIWHGGIHFDQLTNAMLKQDDGVGVIADGEIVAYRLDDHYPELDYPDRKIAKYSTSFVLVRHKLQLPSVADLSGSSSTQTPAPAAGASGTQSATPASSASGAPLTGHASSSPGTSQPASSTAATEPPADDLLEFYSLYMHLLDYAHYDSAGKDAIAANKAPTVQRMPYWKGDRHFIVGSKAKDTQQQRVDPMATLLGDDFPLDGDGMPDPVPPATGLHIRNLPEHGKVIGILPQGSEITIVGTATTGYARIDKILSGAPVAETVGDDVPAEATTGWVFLGELDSKIIPNPRDCVVVLDTPFPVNAGDKVGYLGQYHRYRDASLLPPRDTRPLLHLEVFAGDTLKSFVDRCRDRCSSIGDKLKKPMLVVSPGAMLVPHATDPDQKIPKDLKLVPVPGVPKSGPWVKVQPTQITTPAGHDHAKGKHSTEKPKSTPIGSALWVDSNLSGKTSDGATQGWASFPLQIASAAAPAAIYPDVFTPAELQQTDSAEDDQQQKWWKVTVGTGKGESTTGWVCSKNHPNTAWQSPWQWPGFEIIDNSSVSVSDSFKRAIYVRGDTFDTEEDEFSPIASGVNGSDLIKKLEKAIDHDGNSTITATELKAAQETSWLAEALSHLIVRYESEWGGSMEKWDQLSETMKEHKQLWESELERIEKLQWWNQVKSAKGFLPNPIVYHMHPIGLVGNFVSSCNCINYDAIWVQRAAPAYKDDQIVNYSHYRLPIDKTPGRLAGNSRRGGDASKEVQIHVIDLLVQKSRNHKLSREDIAMVLAMTCHESGFNPDAAAGTTSASGLGQFTDATATPYGINSDSARFDAAQGAEAMVEHYLENKRLAQNGGATGRDVFVLTYAYHHDGPTLAYGGKEISESKVMPLFDTILKNICADVAN